MVTAIVLINASRSKFKSVISELNNIDGVTEVYSIAGEYDIAAIVRVEDNAKLSSIVTDQMPHHIDGITHAKTLFALDVVSDFDLKSIFEVK